MSEVTRILSAIEQGDLHAAEQLLPLVYDELRKLATAKLAQEKAGQTLEATALVHEAYLRLVGQEETRSYRDRNHFFAAAVSTAPSRRPGRTDLRPRGRGTSAPRPRRCWGSRSNRRRRFHRANRSKGTQKA
ncbi:MAG TPA: ECF-type sigma factor [Gemmataceae bacterium]|nr:ECF-type sigma factor [Gemmataceae bacterium]